MGEKKVALSISNVSKSYGDLKVLEGVNLDIYDGEFHVLLGESGCGKTTLLKIIAGLLPLDSGAVIQNGEDVTDIAPYRRDMDMVFQNYALFPHMTVFDNVAFGLRMKGVEKGEIRSRVEKSLSLIRMEGTEDRAVTQLSGGQQQRIALVRALVLESSLLLLDEPLSDLDAKLRAAMRVEISQIQKQLGMTSVLVTHDQTEAMTMADRISLMKEGVIQQVSPPDEIYEHPNNVYVATFIGLPEMNLFDGKVQDDQFVFDQIGYSLAMDDFRELLYKDLKETDLPDGRYIVGVRPEDFLFDVEEDSPLRMEGRMFFEEYLGSDFYIHVNVEGNKIICEATPEFIRTITMESELHLSWKKGKVHLFDAETEKRVNKL